ncbi:MAG: isocitrate/isopropylmalate dehydrogenase family protein [Thermoplasmatales archaeon]
MNKLTIPCIAGDGIGPEVIREGKKVVEAALEMSNIDVEWIDYDIGAERYLKTGKLITEDELEEMKHYPAIYLGAVGDPRIKPGILEQGIIIRMRVFFDQYINLRPVKLYPGVESPLRDKKDTDIHFYIVRENTEDFYSDFGIKLDNGDPHEMNREMKRNMYSINFNVQSSYKGRGKYSYQLGYLTESNCERVFNYSFDLARKKGLKRVITADKANVMPIYDLWREVFDRVSSLNPDIKTDKYFADALSMWFVRKPETLTGVVVLPNLFGDILSDLGAAIQGGLGLAPGGNINPEGTSMFEPIHGSAPSYAGKNVANPIAAILAGSMLLDHVGLSSAANTIQSSVSKLLMEHKFRTYDLGGNSKTSEVGDQIVKIILNS